VIRPRLKNLQSVVDDRRTPTSVEAGGRVLRQAMIQAAAADQRACKDPTLAGASSPVRLIAPLGGLSSTSVLHWLTEVIGVGWVLGRQHGWDAASGSFGVRAPACG
jgi:hypothetical protein